MRLCLRVMMLALAALGLAGCLIGTPRHLMPLSDDVKSELTRTGTRVGAPMYVRIFKQESELEVWLENPDGAYTHFRTYKICKWSGALGPKVKEGDMQAPEGFYVVTSKQMHPFSEYHLAFNIGYPNAYDRAWNRTGSNLMVHGDCKSVGCYAMSDNQIREIFSLAREAFTAGQREFPVHAFPFRMTAENLAAHKGEPWHAFWENLKEGHDAFDRLRRPPVVGVKKQRYVFFRDAQTVPPEFQLQTASAGANLPRLVTGWE